MPIEIRELVIKATIGEGAASQNASSDQIQPGGSSSTDEERLIKRVVEKVMELLKMRHDR
ncbi:MAG: DUF5908 family protein [Bacteroidota bacterium]